MNSASEISVPRVSNILATCEEEEQEKVTSPYLRTQEVCSPILCRNRQAKHSGVFEGVQHLRGQLARPIDLEAGLSLLLPLVHLLQGLPLPLQVIPNVHHLLVESLVSLVIQDLPIVVCDLLAYQPTSA